MSGKKNHVVAAVIGDLTANRKRIVSVKKRYAPNRRGIITEETAECQGLYLHQSILPIVIRKRSIACFVI